MPKESGLYNTFDNTKQTSEIIANNSLMHDQISDLLKLKLKFNNRDRKQILIILENFSEINILIYSLNPFKPPSPFKLV